MLSKNMLNKLNAQLNLEFFSSNIYLQMSAWCDSQGLSGCAGFLYKQAKEELDHMDRIFKYILERGSMALVGKIDEPATQYASIEEIFKKSYKHECLVTSKIHELNELALKEKDYTTQNFLQWFIAEQHEEETQVQTILDKIKLIGADRLYLIDNELKRIAMVRE